jgi:hypothetical protein
MACKTSKLKRKKIMANGGSISGTETNSNVNTKITLGIMDKLLERNRINKEIRSNLMAGGGALSFNQMFAQAREAGLDTFEWRGKKYGTMTADEAIQKNQPQWIYKDRPNYMGSNSGTDIASQVISPEPTSSGIAPGEARMSTNEEYVEPEKPRITASRRIVNPTIQNQDIVPQEEPIDPYQGQANAQSFLQPPSGGLFESVTPDIKKEIPVTPKKLFNSNPLLNIINSGMSVKPTQVVKEGVKSIVPLTINTKKETVYNNPKSQTSIKKQEEQYIPPVEQQVSLPDDVNKQVNINRNNSKFETWGGKYFVLSKENGILYAFNNKHEVIDSTPVGRGKVKGDFSNKADPDSDIAGPSATTAAGTAVLKSEEDSPYIREHYGSPFWRLYYPNTSVNRAANSVYKDSQNTGLHAIYPTERKFREAIIMNPNIIEKLVSFGCINVPVNKIMGDKMRPNAGDSIYITKEPLRNKLITKAGQSKVPPLPTKTNDITAELPEFAIGGNLFEEPQDKRIDPRTGRPIKTTTEVRNNLGFRNTSEQWATKAARRGYLGPIGSTSSDTLATKNNFLKLGRNDMANYSRPDMPLTYNPKYPSSNKNGLVFWDIQNRPVANKSFTNAATEPFNYAMEHNKLSSAKGINKTFITGTEVPEFGGGGGFSGVAGKAGMFYNLGKNMSAAVDPKDDYGVGTGSEAQNQLSGMIDPLEGWKMNLKHAKAGKFELADVSRLFGLGGADTNRELADERDSLLNRQHAAQVNSTGQNQMYDNVMAEGGLNLNDVSRRTDYKGEPHSKGGINLPIGAQVEGGESRTGDIVHSDKIKITPEIMKSFGDKVPLRKRDMGKTIATVVKNRDNRFKKRSGDEWNDAARKISQMPFEEMSDELSNVYKEAEDMATNSMMAGGGHLSKEKAGIMLHEGMIRGKKLTDKQQKYFAWRANQEAAGGLNLKKAWDWSSQPENASTLVSGAGILSSLLQRPTNTTYGRARTSLTRTEPINVEAGMGRIRRQFGNSRERLRRINPRGYMNNLSGLGAQEAETISDYTGQMENQNAQMRNQASMLDSQNRNRAGMFNTQIGMEEVNAREMNKAAKWNAVSAGVANLATQLGQRSRDQKLIDAQKAYQKDMIDLQKKRDRELNRNNPNRTSIPETGFSLPINRSNEDWTNADQNLKFNDYSNDPSSLYSPLPEQQVDEYGLPIESTDLRYKENFHRGGGRLISRVSKLLGKRKFRTF